MRVALCCIGLALGGACGPSQASPDPPRVEPTSSKPRVQALRAREAALRSHYAPQEQPSWLDASGADPYRIAAYGSEPPAYIGILRGSKAIVALDEELLERSRLSLPEAPSALCVSRDNWAFVGSRWSPAIQRVALGFRDLGLPAGRLNVDATGVADLACAQGERLYALTTDPPRLVTFEKGKVLGEMPALPGPLRLLLRGHYLLESSLFERCLRVLELDSRGVPAREVARIQHDGPIWGFDAVERDGELVIALSGVEDKPLVRAHGEFENIDSFVWLYRFGNRIEPLAQLDVGELGLVVPKSIGLVASGADWVVTALAAGSGRALVARFERDGRLVSVEGSPVPPGASDAVLTRQGAVYASPLLDAWVKVEERRQLVRHVDPERRPEPNVRLGEALFFTNLMAPRNVSTGTHSRFSCETCHFEGGVDGRTHYTGRGDVSVVTKPLFGLANNRPHFSRAMDRDLSSVSHNEFRVAGAGSQTDPWFSLDSSRFPWLVELGLSRGEASALDLREALVDFLYAFSHEPNPRVLGRSRFSDLEARGARAFERHCESCHSARTFSDDPASRLDLAAWESAIFRRNAALVWARADYEKTGVLPYVHERGTRVTSLRRLSLKPRYFTNGSAPTLADVLLRFRAQESLHQHEGGSHAAALDEATRRALLAFLELL
jgi:hypothetical protein